jgi:hypothetical protein
VGKTGVCLGQPCCNNETEAHSVSFSQTEDRSYSTGEMGEVKEGWIESLFKIDTDKCNSPLAVNQNGTALAPTFLSGSHPEGGKRTWNALW